jgi:hypothetical protein
MEKIPSKYEQRYFIRSDLLYSSPVPPALPVGDSAGRIARELWWRN